MAVYECLKIKSQIGLCSHVDIISIPMMRMERHNEVADGCLQVVLPSTTIFLHIPFHTSFQISFLLTFHQSTTQRSGRWVFAGGSSIDFHIPPYSISHLFPNPFPTYISLVDHTAKWQMGICRWFLHRPVNDAPSMTNNCHPWVTRHCAPASALCGDKHYHNYSWVTRDVQQPDRGQT